MKNFRTKEFLIVPVSRELLSKALVQGRMVDLAFLTPRILVLWDNLEPSDSYASLARFGGWGMS